MSVLGMIYSISFYQRLIMKNSFKVSKNILTPTLKDNFLKFSMLLVRESKLIIHKKV